MGIVDYIIIGIIAALVALALYSIIRQRKNGKGCCGDCTRCSVGCKKNNKDKNKEE